MTDPATLSDPRLDRLYNLLPPVIRASDAYVGLPLQALLRVAAEQLNLVEDDISRLLDNWFVETCDNWVLPYLGELLGSEPNSSIPTPPADDSPLGRTRAQAAYPRRAVGRLVRLRRRKGVLLQLQELALDLTGWPSRVVEFRQIIAKASSARFPELGGARTVDFRTGDRLDLANGPFTSLSRRADVRSLASTRTVGHGNLTSVGLFLWRLKVNTIQAGEARLLSTVHQPDDYRLDRYHLDPFGRDLPLYTLAMPLPNPTKPAAVMEVPDPIRLWELRNHMGRYYGPTKSLFLWHTGHLGPKDPRPSTPPTSANDPSIVQPCDIVVHDLGRWEDSLPPDHLAVADDSCWLGVVIDPTRGRVLFRRKNEESALWARYNTAFPADIGGGGYFRDVSPPATLIVGGPTLPSGSSLPWFPTLSDALEYWDGLKGNRNVVIEIRDDATHFIGQKESSALTAIGPGEYLQVRSDVGRRPVVRQVCGDADAEWIVVGSASPTGSGNAVFVLDGVVLADTSLQLKESFSEVQLSNTTLVPEPLTSGALKLLAFQGCLSIEGSVICGAILVRPELVEEVCDRATHRRKPVEKNPHPLQLARVTVSDSIIMGERETGKDGSTSASIALTGWPRASVGANQHDVIHGYPAGHVAVSLLRTTILGDVNVHALDLAEDSIFSGGLRVTDTSRGCIRFCSLRTSEQRTPTRHACQPDLALEEAQRSQPTALPAQAALASAAGSIAGWTAATTAAVIASVAPRFTSLDFSNPAFAQLSKDCPSAVSQGASDASEMGAFHNLFNPYRETLLQAGMADNAPADADAAFLFVN